MNPFLPLPFLLSAAFALDTMSDSVQTSDSTTHGGGSAVSMPQGAPGKDSAEGARVLPVPKTNESTPSSQTSAAKTDRNNGSRVVPAEKLVWPSFLKPVGFRQYVAFDMGVLSLDECTYANNGMASLGSSSSSTCEMGGGIGLFEMDVLFGRPSGLTIGASIQGAGQGKTGKVVTICDKYGFGSDCKEAEYKKRILGGDFLVGWSLFVGSPLMVRILAGPSYMMEWEEISECSTCSQNENPDFGITIRPELAFMYKFVSLAVVRRIEYNGGPYSGIGARIGVTFKD